MQAPGDDESAVGESEQDDDVEILVERLVDHVLHVRRQVHLRARQMGPFADAGQARREHLVT